MIGYILAFNVSNAWDDKSIDIVPMASSLYGIIRTKQVFYTAVKSLYRSLNMNRRGQLVIILL